MSLTPELCRAGRALLAWTQRDLAERARTAVSTIADFERGARSPVANSSEAIEAALRAGGVGFEGGRVTLIDGGSGFNRLDGGRAIPLISSTDLKAWAERIDSSATLPRLVSMLIRASAGPDAMLHFPADEGVRERGWDGTCYSGRSVNYVPEGLSRWELSVESNPASKASRDFTKRVKEGDAATRAMTTYVTVSMRSWPKKELWVAERLKLGEFKDVRVIDVHDLTEWLAMHVQVAHWLAVRCGKRSVSGVMSLEEAWRRWALATNPPLTEDIVLAGRDHQATDVLAWLKGPPCVLHVQAAETEEAIAFLFAAIQQLPEAYRETYRTHALVAESDSAVREISVAMNAQIIVMNGANSGFAESIAASGHYVYALHDPTLPLQDGVVLTDVRRVDLAYALEDAGKKSDDARALANRSGGSIAILRRILSSTATLPDWMAAVSSNIRNAMFFAGAWDESVYADQTVIAELAGVPFEDVRREIAELASGLDAPLRLSISKIQIKSAQYLWPMIAPRLRDADLVAYLGTAQRVLSEIDPRYYEAERDRLIAYGTKPPLVTKELRRGLLETLNVMAASPEYAEKTLPFLEGRIRGFVRALLEDPDAPHWWSMRDVLPLLAEAAPQEFLDSVERSLCRDDAPISALLQSGGHGFFARDYISDLTTALERLAWFPDYFADAAMVLASLAAKDNIANRHGNRPSAVLRQIFVLWQPQTLASADERLAALERLRQHYPNVAWELMLSLMPKYGGDASSFSSKPAWRRLPADETATAPLKTQVKDAAIIFSWLLEDAGRIVTRWDKLLQNTTAMGEKARLRATDGFLMLARDLDDQQDRLAARDVARRVLHRHREFRTAGWAMQEATLAPLQAAFEYLTPTDIIDRERWVFDSHVECPDPVPDHDIRAIEAHNDAHRTRVARQLLASRDVDVILAMASVVGHPLQLGIALGRLDLEEEWRSTLVARGAQSSKTSLQRFALGVVDGSITKCGVEWAQAVVRGGIEARWPTRALAVVLQGMPRNIDTFNLAREAGTETERDYWQTALWMWFIHCEHAAIVRVVEAKLRVGQPIEAAELIGQTGPKKFSSDLLLQTLTSASSQIRSQRGRVDSMLSHYCGLIFDHLLADQNVDRNTLTKLEWEYFGLFQASDRSASLLEAGLARDPQFFIDVVSSVYRGDGDENTVPDEEDAAQRIAIAEQSYTLLQKWSLVPGSRPDGTIDDEALTAWVKQVRALAIPARRVDIIDQQIGAILSAARAENDGAWPPKPVREILELVRSKELELGFEIGARNRSGVTTRGPLDGGEQERDRRGRYEALAQRFRSTYPRTAAVLRAIAVSYKVDGVYMDQLSEAIDRA